MVSFIFSIVPMIVFFKACFELEQCAGVIGGRPNHALFYLGYTCDDLICLDPHETQEACTGKKILSTYLIALHVKYLKTHQILLLITLLLIMLNDKLGTFSKWAV